MKKFLLTVISLVFLSQTAFADLTVINTNTGETTAATTDLVEHVELSSIHGITSGDWLILYSVGATVDSNSTAYVRINVEKNDALVTNQFSSEPNSPSTARKSPFQWWYFNDGGLSTDNFQIKVSTNGTQAVRCSNGGIAGIYLGDLVQDTDFVIGAAEPGTDIDTASSATFIDAETITIPANNSGKNWLIFGRYVLQAGAVGGTGNGRSRFFIDDTTAVMENTRFDAEDANDRYPFMQMYVYTVPDNNTHTIDFQYSVGSTGSDIIDANIIGINLDELTAIYDFESGEADETNSDETVFIDYAGAAKSVNFSSAGEYLLLGTIAGGNTTAITNGYNAQLLFDNTTAYMTRLFDPNSTASLERWPNLFLNQQTIVTPGSKDVDVQYRPEDDASTATTDHGAMVVIGEASAAVADTTIQGATLQGSTLN